MFCHCMLVQQKWKLRDVCLFFLLERLFRWPKLSRGAQILFQEYWNRESEAEREKKRNLTKKKYQRCFFFLFLYSKIQTNSQHSPKKRGAPEKGATQEKSKIWKRLQQTAQLSSFLSLLQQHFAQKTFIRHYVTSVCFVFKIHCQKGNAPQKILGGLIWFFFLLVCLWKHCKLWL